MAGRARREVVDGLREGGKVTCFDDCRLPPVGCKEQHVQHVRVVQDTELQPSWRDDVVKGNMAIAIVPSLTFWAHNQCTGGNLSCMWL